MTWTLLLLLLSSAPALAQAPAVEVGRNGGPRPLIEDGSVRSKASSLLNLRLGHRFPNALSVAGEVFNLLNNEVSDIDYYYESQLRGEPASVNDIHFHPAEKRLVRLAAEWRF
ncbi:MAG TPA: hypothetical protein VGH73_00930 [Thermoanaerobaculia bacterium]|jgi:hypothetical protein